MDEVEDDERVVALVHSHHKVQARVPRQENGRRIREREKEREKGRVCVCKRERVCVFM